MLQKLPVFEALKTAVMNTLNVPGLINDALCCQINLTMLFLVKSEFTNCNDNFQQDAPSLVRSLSLVWQTLNHGCAAGLQVSLWFSKEVVTLQQQLSPPQSWPPSLMCKVGLGLASMAFGSGCMGVPVLYKAAGPAGLPTDRLAVGLMHRAHMWMVVALCMSDA